MLPLRADRSDDGCSCTRPRQCQWYKPAMFACTMCYKRLWHHANRFNVCTRHLCDVLCHATNNTHPLHYITHPRWGSPDAAVNVKLEEGTWLQVYAEPDSFDMAKVVSIEQSNIVHAITLSPMNAVIHAPSSNPISLDYMLLPCLRLKDAEDVQMAWPASAKRGNWRALSAHAEACLTSVVLLPNTGYGAHAIGDQVIPCMPAWSHC